MRARMIRGLLAAVLAVFALTSAVLSHPQDVIDRIAARVENDIILLSEVRELGRYQQLLDGKSETEEQLLDRLIDQWIVRTEAEASHFPQPSEEDINHGVERVQRSFASSEEFDSRKKQCGLSDADVRRIVAAQLYLSNYLDSRFRPSVQIDAKAIEDFYQTALVPRAKARGQAPPALDEARDLIQEALVQRGITEQADRWLKESRTRLHIDKLLSAGKNDA
jgi:parvulin-like peptidyl-prolyl isomerase